jgi:sec-independent protein translocase protein TatA
MFEGSFPTITYAFTTWQIILLLVVILLIFGARKIPEIAKSVGSGLKEFKKATSDLNDAVIDDNDKNTPYTSQPNRSTAATDNMPPSPNQTASLEEIEQVIRARNDLTDQQKEEMLEKFRKTKLPN